MAKITKKLGIDNYGLKPIVSHIFPKEEEMVSRKLNQRLNVDFFWDTADLKKHVFIYVRKQIGQEMEGVSAC